MTTADDALPAPHRHVVTFYDNDAELVLQVADFVADGLAVDETVVLVGTAAHQCDVDASLQANGIDVMEARASGRFITLDAATTLASLQTDGLVDASRFVTVIGEVLDDAARSGRPVRVFGEMVALLWSDRAAQEALRLEEMWNELAVSRDFALLCAYPVRSFFDDADLAAVAHACRQHSDLVPPHGYASSCATATTADAHAVASFLPVPAAVRAARSFVTDSLATWRLDHLAADARLIVSELATNALSHASSPFRVSLHLAGRSVRIGVEDVSSVHPARRRPALTEASGRGMTLVDGLSSAWGTTSLDGGKLVWSDLAFSRN